MAGERRTPRAGVFFILGIAFLSVGLAGHPAFVGIGGAMLVVGMANIIRERTTPDGGDE